MPESIFGAKSAKPLLSKCIVGEPGMAKKAKKIRLTRRERARMGVRKKLRGSTAKPRLCVFRSSKHIYVQAISDDTGQTLASASTRDVEVQKIVADVDTKDLTSSARSTKSMAAAKAAGLVAAERIKAKGIESVVFDRNGFRYHGRVRALAEGMRAGGLAF